MGQASREKMRYKVSTRNGIQELGSIRPLYSISNTNNTRKYRLFQQYFDKVDHLPQSLSSCSRKKRSSTAKVFDPAISFRSRTILPIRPRKCYYKSRPVSSPINFTLSRVVASKGGRGRKREREKGMRVSPICRENGKPQKNACAPGALPRR